MEEGSLVNENYLHRFFADWNLWQAAVIVLSWQKIFPVGFMLREKFVLNRLLIFYSASRGTHSRQPWCVPDAYSASGTRICALMGALWNQSLFPERYSRIRLARTRWDIQGRFEVSEVRGNHLRLARFFQKI